MPAPLANIKVLDLSRVLAGPYCAMQLADLGADVIKVERPGAGDDTRGWGPPFAGGESAYFLCCNRNKRSVAINLKEPAGRDLVARLADGVDVLIENFLPGTLDGWGLGYAALAARNPGLVYCSITGFGQNGPRRDEPGYDIMIQALAGVMSITGESDGSPMKVGVAISDITAGLFASQAILATLVGRASTGRGERIDIALFDSTIAWLANVGQNYLLSGELPRRLGTEHPNIVPYQVFATADGSVVIGVGNDAQFRRFAALLGRAEWGEDPRFTTNAARVRNRALLMPMIKPLVQERDTREWLRELEAASIPCGAVHSVAEAFNDPQAVAREMVREVIHPTIGPLKLAGTPFRFGTGSPARQDKAWRPPPRLGEHTTEVLSSVLGFSENEIHELVSRGVIESLKASV
ncbi:MAG: CoA transferase [Planctomycetota bacterium]|nr:CoA transferase [Planctomycetota bacterium]